MKVRVLRAFTKEGLHGNPLGLIEDGTLVPREEDRLRLARQLGFSESAIIDDIDRSVVSFYSARRMVPFAGHAAVGVAWALSGLLGRAADTLLTPSGPVPTWSESGATWVRSSLSNTAPWWHERLPSPDAVESLTGPVDPVQDMTQLWAWIDEPAGLMRVRTFAGRVGLPEDEACGSGAMRLAAAFGRSLSLIHGKGSLIYARPGSPGYADIGGFVTEDDSIVLDRSTAKAEPT